MVWLSPTESPDDLWLDAIRQTRAALPDRQLIFIGSSELSAVQVRASIQQTADAYLCMLSHNEAVAELQHAIVAQPELFADRLAHNMYERSVVVQAELLDGMLEWTERRLLIRSHRQAADQESELLARLGRAQRELLDLNERKRGKRRPQSLQAMREAAATILDEHGVTGLVALRFDEAVDERTVRRYRGRPTTTRVARLVTVSSSIDEAALAAVREQLGWQVYVTTMSAEALPIEQAARTHGEAAQAFERMRGRPLSLPPGLLQRGDHMRGLVRMLAIGLRAMALLDATARTRVADMPGLVWQRTGAMNQPTTPVGERLLEAFREITLTAFSDGQEYHYHLTALSAVQRRVLELLMLSSETYHRPG
jgi:transposase